MAELGIALIAAYLLIGLIGIVGLVCFIFVLVKMFENDQVGLGIACIILSICTGVGPIIAFVVGWTKTREWGLKNVMVAWTATVLVQVVLVIGVIVFVVGAAAHVARDGARNLADWDYSMEEFSDFGDVEAGPARSDSEESPNLDPQKNSIGMLLVPISAGDFVMGTGENEHAVTISEPFRMGVFEVTQREYEKVMGANPSQNKAPYLPVTNVSWVDAVAFCEKLSALRDEQAAGRVYRLPSEAEWEYACRAGTTTLFGFGDDADELNNHAWSSGNAAQFNEPYAHQVGRKRPNRWGLFDMHGNVAEWCHDWFAEYEDSSVANPSGPATGTRRTLRGGGWRDLSAMCRSSYRNANTMQFRALDLGFRVVEGPPLRTDGDHL